MCVRICVCVFSLETDLLLDIYYVMESFVHIYNPF